MKFYVAIIVTLTLAVASDAKRCDEIERLNINLNEILGQDKPWYVTHDRNNSHKCLEYDYQPDASKPNTVGATTLTNKDDITFTYTLLQSDTNYTVIGEEFSEPVYIGILHSQTKFDDGDNHIPGTLCSFGCTQDGEKLKYFRCYATDRDGEGKKITAEIVKKFQDDPIEFEDDSEITDVSKDCNQKE